MTLFDLFDAESPPRYLGRYVAEPMKLSCAASPNQ
jgi:hypothetical protein